MQGQMMQMPLTLTSLLERARRLFPHKQIVTKTGAALERSSYGEVAERAGRLAHALERLGVRAGERVATFAWNNTRHLELYLAVPSMGAVLHPLNIRLPADQLEYIVRHAEDRVIFVDPSLLPAVEKLAPSLDCVRHYVVMSGSVPPGCSLPGALAYEALIQGESAAYAWPELREDAAAAMCYTSGTTGHPKGVVYSHRSILLHTFGVCMADSMGLSERETFMPVVPMFHAMAWGTPFACAMVGAKLVMPGAHLAPRDLAELIEAERVSMTAGVPTLWLGLRQLLEVERFDLSSLRTMVCGGSAVPRSLIEFFEKRLGVTLLQAWGMTETSPLGTVSRLTSAQLALDEEARFDLRARQGLPVPGVEIRIVDDAGREAPWDGKTFGELQVRGPWVVSGYYKDERSNDAFAGGWFRTGDVATIEPGGSMQIVDRTKDLVKSGGEWISSVDLENLLMSHPKVLEAAVIAVPHPKWQERPLACVVPQPGLEVTKPEIYEFLRPRLASWSLPDDIVMLEAIPRTSVGKFDKKVLRARFQDYTLPSR